MLSVALTGNLASGKSTVLRLWEEAGVPVVSADALSRAVVQPGTEVMEVVRRTFGDGVISADGTLDRAALRKSAFADPAARHRLEAILHPRIAELRQRWLEERAHEGATLVVAEIPLLFETGLEKDFDITVFVDAPEDMRLARALADPWRGLADDEARRIMASQMEPAEKWQRAGFVIENHGSIAELRVEAEALLAKLRAQARRRAEGESRGGVLRLDLHLHTWASHDCVSDPERVLAAAQARGVERLAVTDHNRLALALKLSKRYPDHVIPGEEVRTAEGIDVIGLYLSEEIPRGTPALEVVARVRAQGGVVYLPHPYAPGKGGGGRLAEELAPLVDVVEVFNARLHPARLNEPALALADRHKKLKGAGSDAHTTAEVGGAFVELPRHANQPAAFLLALEQGRVRGETAPRAVHLASTWAKLRKRLRSSSGDHLR